MILAVGPRATPMPKAMAMEAVIINRKILISIDWVFFCFVILAGWLVLLILILIIVVALLVVSVMCCCY